MWHLYTQGNLGGRKVPTCLSPLRVTEGSADAEQDKQQNSSERGGYCQRDCAVIFFFVLQNLCN